MSRPLDGLLVASPKQAIAAPCCTRLLADQGARVIKVERPVPALGEHTGAVLSEFDLSHLSAAKVRT
jgi:crotonobetainyl-CoA:carnitine CoA-transferase CaiB-like acyl-CoA transferase